MHTITCPDCSFANEVPDGVAGVQCAKCGKFITAAAREPVAASGKDSAVEYAGKGTRSPLDREPLVPFKLFRDRNYSVVNWVSGVLAIDMMGIFLPLTIYFQSVLGFSALKAGLVMAPASVMSMFIAPVAGRTTDKIGGKYILMSGLTLFGVGMG